MLLLALARDNKTAELTVVLQQGGMAAHVNGGNRVSGAADIQPTASLASG
jgi:hypothetical protein